jgi:hypothetical protein
MAYHVKAHSTTTTASNSYTRNSHEIEARKPMIATRSTPHFYFFHINNTNLETKLIGQNGKKSQVGPYPYIAMWHNHTRLFDLDYFHLSGGHASSSYLEDCILPLGKKGYTFLVFFFF